MFSGIVEEVGRVKTFRRTGQGGVLVVECEKVVEGTRLGDSISVNGVCLTVVEVQKKELRFDVSYETLKRTNFSALRSGLPVNLERSLRVGDRISGHFLLGHVDCTGKVLKIERKGEGYLFTFAFPRRFDRYVVEKGSIGIDGISLTVAGVSPGTVDIAVIPHTYRNTNLKYKLPGDLVNIEFDIIGKYVEKLLGYSTSTLTSSLCQSP